MPAGLQRVINYTQRHHSNLDCRASILAASPAVPFGRSTPNIYFNIVAVDTKRKNHAPHNIIAVDTKKKNHAPPDHLLAFEEAKVACVDICFIQKREVYKTAFF